MVGLRKEIKVKNIITLMFLGLFIVACGDDGKDGAQGEKGMQGQQGSAGTNGSNGSDGKDGEDALAPKQTLTLKPSRDYDPSSFSPVSEDLGAGVYSLPEELPLTTGVAGTGWASITLNNMRYCYQGDGVNNSNAGSKFEYEGAFELPGECFSASLSDEPLEGSSFFEDMEFEAAVHGGGVSSGIRTFTEVEAVIEVRELN